MLRLPGRLIGDCWFFVHGGRCHAYLLTAPAEVVRHAYWEVTHAVSDDLRAWEVLGTCVRPGVAPAWDHGCLATGSVIAHRGGFLMAHSVRWGGPDPAVKLLASDDLHDWRPVGNGPALALADVLDVCEPVGGGARAFPHFRDPFLFEHAGEVWVAVTASRRDGPADGRGTLALGRLRGEGGGFEPAGLLDLPAVAQELECPQLRRVGERWALIFSSAGEWFTADYRGRHRPAGGLFVAAADSPLGPFDEPTPVEVTLPGYAGQVIEFGGDWHALSTLPNGDGALADPVPVGDALRRRVG